MESAPASSPTKRKLGLKGGCSVTALIRSGTYVVEAYANWSRWVARCGLCPSAEQLRPHGRTFNGPNVTLPPWFECVECGTVTEVIWPAEQFVAAVERLLMMRPDPSTRNWLPGETLSDLMLENGAHGIFDHLDRLGLDAEPGQTLLAVDDQGMSADHLPPLKPRIRQAIRP